MREFRCDILHLSHDESLPSLRKATCANVLKPRASTYSERSILDLIHVFHLLRDLIEALNNEVCSPQNGDTVPSYCSLEIARVYVCILPCATHSCMRSDHRDRVYCISPA